MATFERGVQDQLMAIRPPDDLMQFNAQVLTTGQSQYDQAHSKLSKMYGTILNAGLTREDNVLAREEFFKLIGQDLHKIAGMDLSKSSNVSKAQNVFKQIYTNKPLVKDMVWTKNFQEEMQRAEGFRNCVDPDECGGQYWEDGVKYMQYKREEFKNSNRDESMRFADVEYIPYNNVIAQALDDLKEMGGFNMQTTSFAEGGKYRVTTKNGGQAVNPMVMMFNKLYAKNPKFYDMFKVMAYNQRKDWTYNAVANGEYESLEEAAVGYVEQKRDVLEKEFESMHKDVTHDYEQLKQLAEGYQQDLAEGRIQEGDPEYDEMVETMELYQSAEGLKSYTDMVKRAQKGMNNLTTMNNISDYLDNVQAQVSLNNEIEDSAKILAFKDYSQEFKADEYAVLAQKHSYNVALEKLRFDHDKELELIKNKDKEAEFRAQAQIAANQYSQSQAAVENFNPYYEAFSSLKSQHTEAKWTIVDTNITKEGLEKWAKNIPKDAQQELDNYITLKEAEKVELKKKANKSAMTAIDYYNRGNAEPSKDLKFTLHKDVLSQNEVKIISENYLDYDDNPQLEQWATMIADDPNLSAMLSASEYEWASTSIIGQLFSSPTGNKPFWQITPPFTGNPATTFLLNNND